MENYNQMAGQENKNSNRTNFPPYGVSSMTAHHHHHHHHMNMNDSGGGNNGGGGGGDYFQSALVAAAAAEEGGGGNSSHHHNTITKREHHQQQQQQSGRFYNNNSNYPLLTSEQQQQQLHFHHQQVGSSRNDDDDNNNNMRRVEVEAMKSKIIAHPQYPNLLQAYTDCQKVGAPPEMAAKLTAIRQEFESRQQNLSCPSSSSTSPAAAAASSSSNDPELDQFMEAYYNMLVKYREELTRPVQEAIEFMSRVEAQLHLLTDGRSSRVGFNSGANAGSSEEEEDPENSGGGETELPEIDPRAEDRELKNHLLRKYSGYLSSLKQELSKKKKKGKLPKEARQKLLSWWELHYKWPYPSESEKVGLAESTGLDQKQINNWFINQRKRHWKPSEDMQFMVMDGIHPQNAALYMEGHYLGDGPYRFGT